MQHFNIQQRQYRGSGFQTVYWPQPQFQDLDRYLQLFGVEQLREVLFDRTQSHLNLETQVNRTARARVRPAKGRLAFLDPRRRPALRPHFSHHSSPRRPALYLGEPICPAPGRPKQCGHNGPNPDLHLASSLVVPMARWLAATGGLRPADIPARLPTPSRVAYRAFSRGSLY